MALKRHFAGDEELLARYGQAHGAIHKLAPARLLRLTYGYCSIHLLPGHASPDVGFLRSSGAQRAGADPTLQAKLAE